MGCTGPALSKRFQRALGLPLKRYLRRLVVARAQRTLAEGAESISSVAEALGYEDTAYFHRLFKSETGMTARRWRESERAGARSSRPQTHPRVRLTLARSSTL
jgi:AraC-like DNA-binding protein